MSERLAALEAQLDALLACGVDGLVDGELAEEVLGMARVHRKVEALDAMVLARFDTAKVWAPSGARTAASWVAWHTRTPQQVARKRVRHARAVRDLPAVEGAWTAGEIDRAHVTTLLEARTPRTESAFQRDHGVLVEAAVTLGFSEFKRTIDRWVRLVDPDGAEDKAAADLAAREVHLSQSFGGLYFGKMTFDPINGGIVADTLREIERELFEKEWADTRDQLGRDPLIVELPRTPAQRRADALVEMAIRARTAPADGRRPAPLFTVVIDHPTLAGPVLELFNRTVLTPGQAAQWLTEADVERIVFGPDSRLLDVGQQRRFFRGALRHGIEIRDRECYHPSCDEPPEQIDHIDPYAAGGLTTQTNAQGACGFHNRWRNTHPDTPDPP